MAPLLLRRRLVDLGVPASAELLDGRDVDGAVVEVLLDLGQLRGQEAAVGADGVAGQRDRARLGDVQLEELERLGAGVLEGEGRRLDFVEQPRSGVHGDDEVIHLRQLLGRGVDHEIGAFGHDVSGRRRSPGWRSRR